MSKHSKAFKVKVVESCLSGMSAVEAQHIYGVNHSHVRAWLHRYQRHGKSCFDTQYTQRSAREKLSILQHMWTNFWSIRHTCAYFNIPSHSTLQTWVKKYRLYGLAGLKDKPRGQAKMTKTSKYVSKKAVKDMSQEELRAELEYRRAEVAVLKKLEALMPSKPIQTHKERK